MVGSLLLAGLEGGGHMVGSLLLAGLEGGGHCHRKQHGWVF